MKWILQLLGAWGNSVDDVEASINEILARADVPEAIRAKLFEYLIDLKTEITSPDALKLQVASWVAELTHGKFGFDPNAAGLL